MSMIMAEFPEEMYDQINFDEVAPKILEESAETLKESTKNALRSVIQHPGDSDLVNSVHVSKPKATKTDAYVVTAYPSGYSTNTYNRGSRKYPVTQGAKAVWLEYGVAGRQAPRPWRNKAVMDCQAKVEAQMQKKFEEITKI